MVMKAAAAAVLPFILFFLNFNEAIAAAALRGHDIARRPLDDTLDDAAMLRPDDDDVSLPAAAPLNTTASSGIVSFNLASSEAEANQVKLNADGFINFLVSEAAKQDQPPQRGEYLDQCEAHLSKLLTRLDAHYTDASLKTVLTNECLLKREFPNSFESGFSSEKACADFAKDLVAARDEELGSGSTEGFTKFCKEFYDHKFGKEPVDVGSPKCPCIGFDDLEGMTIVEFASGKARYPADLGGSCKAWDDNTNPSCKEGQLPGPGDGWCHQAWCYVDPCNCELDVEPKTSSYLPGATYQGKPIYYSYATCGGTDDWVEENAPEACVNQKGEDDCEAISKCAWTGEKCAGKELVGACEKPVEGEAAEIMGSSDCKCIGIHNQTGATQMHIGKGLVPYPADAGAACKAWDYGTHPDCKGNTVAPWCVQAWCFVDPCSCDVGVPPKTSAYLPDATFQNKPLYWSYKTCGGEDVYTQEFYADACVNQYSKDACMSLSKCGWTGDKCLGKELVDKCPVEVATVSKEDKEPKKEVAKEEEETVDIGSHKCPCIGFDDIDGETLVMIDGKKLEYPADLGGVCQAWDDKTHPMCKEGDTPGPGNGWCAQKWCYVDPCNCDIPSLPKTSSYLPGATYQGKPIYFSYATCGGVDEWTSENYADACVNQESEDDCSGNDKCAWDKKGKKCLGKELLGACSTELDAKKVGNEECRCVGIANVSGTTEVSIGKKKVDYAADVGAECGAWDEGEHPDCKGDDAPDWCAKKWCFVDPCSCELEVPPKTSSYLPDAAFQAKPLYWSYTTCGDKDTYTKEKQKDACVLQKSEKDCGKSDKCGWDGDKCMGKELIGKCPAIEATKKEEPSAGIGSEKCPCVGIDDVDGETTVLIDGDKFAYPADLGGTCQAWDNKKHPSCKPGETPGPGNGWCAQQWCYVDPCNCDLEVLPKTSSYLPEATFQGKTVYYSYATCGAKDEWTAENNKDACVNQESEDDCKGQDKCAWDGEKCGGKEIMGACKVKLSQEMVGNEKCRCIGIDHQPGHTNVTIGPALYSYPADVGASCHPWDFHEHPECKDVANPPDWCSKSWCFVDPCECDLPIPPKTSSYLPEAEFQEKPLYWSYTTCGYDDTYTKENYKTACTNQVTEHMCQALTKCAWANGKCLGKELVGKCPGTHVEENDDGKDGCRCIGLEGLEGETDVTIKDAVVKFPADMGGVCKAWDAEHHPDCKEDGDDNAWCKQKWCYVDPCTCSSPVMPAPSSYLPGSDFQGKALYYSYETCGVEVEEPEASCASMSDKEACDEVKTCKWNRDECIIQAVLGECHGHELRHDAVKEGNKKCQCIGITNVSGTTEVALAGKDLKYPGDLGSHCSSWDRKVHPECLGETFPDWCVQEWCYVDPCECELGINPGESTYLPKASFQNKPLYFSYATCMSTDSWTLVENQDSCALKTDEGTCNAETKCAWDVKECVLKELAGKCAAPEDKPEEPKKPEVKDAAPADFGEKECSCIGWHDISGVTTVDFGGSLIKYPADLGGDCMAWDMNVNPECKGDGEKPAWCQQKWCYVDPCNCELEVLPKISAYMPNATYQGHPVYYSYATCQGKDFFTEDKHPTACVNQADYHSCTALKECSWDGEKCAGKDLLETCDHPTDNKVIGSSGCKCIGVANQTGSLSVDLGVAKVDYPADTGAFCKAWDEKDHIECQGDNRPNWCDHQWCFVDPCDCDTVVPPKVSYYLGDGKWNKKPVYYSYATCGAQDDYTEEYYKTACVNQKTPLHCAQNDKCAWNPKQNKCLGKDIGFFC